MIADLAPPEYSVLSFPRSVGGRSDKGEGIAFVLRDSLKQHVTSTSSFLVQHPCLAADQLTVTYGKQLTNFFCINRPLPRIKQNFTVSTFFDLISDFLKHSDSLPGKTLPMCGFYFLFENVENSNSRTLHGIIDIFNLTQSVTETTHNQGHLLDLVLSEQNDNSMESHLTTQLSCANLMYLYPNESLKPSYTAPSKRSILTAFNISLTLSHQRALSPTTIITFVLSRSSSAS